MFAPIRNKRSTRSYVLSISKKPCPDCGKTIAVDAAKCVECYYRPRFFHNAKPFIYKDCECMVVPVGKRLSAIVSKKYYDDVIHFRWNVRFSGKGAYAYRSYRGNNGEMTTQSLHQFILRGQVNGDIDHEDHDTLNCARFNIRPCTKAQNQTNRGKMKSNKSGYKGVFWDKYRNKHKAAIGRSGKIVWSRRFNSAIEAARAFDMKSIELSGDFAYLNFPEMRAEYMSRLKDAR